MAILEHPCPAPLNIRKCLSQVEADWPTVLNSDRERLRQHFASAHYFLLLVYHQCFPRLLTEIEGGPLSAYISFDAIRHAVAAVKFSHVRGHAI